jgi:hypothetical protein
MPGLSKNQRDRIRAEEIYREELRREFEQQRPPKSLGSQIWAVANSSFGIWLLSSVFVGLMVWSWTTIQEHRAEKKAAAEKLVKVTFEVYNDFWDFYGFAQKSWDYEQYRQALSSLERPQYKLSDFKDKSMKELLWIMGEIPPSSNQKHAQELLNIVGSLWSDVVGPLYGIGTLDEQKKHDIDGRIKDTLNDRVFPILYPELYHPKSPSYRAY